MRGKARTATSGRLPPTWLLPLQMDILTFLSNMTGALAWPVTGFVIALVFRSELKTLVPLLRKLKAGPIEAEFEREIRALELAASSVPALEQSDELEGRTKLLR